MKKIIYSFLFLSLCLLFPSTLFSQKKALDHDVYDQWNRISGTQLSRDGKWAGYVVAPERKDGTLYRQSLPSGQAEGIARGYVPLFPASAAYLAFKIKAPFDSTRKAKIAKAKPDDMPKDSLGIWKASGEVEKMARVKSFAIGKEGGDWMAIYLEKFISPKDTTQQDSAAVNEKKKAVKKGKKDASPLLLYNPVAGLRDTLDQVKSYAVADPGNRIAFITAYGDSIDSTSVQIFVTATQEVQTVYEGPGEAKSLTFDKKGGQLAFLMSADTGKVKIFQLHHWQNGEAADVLVTANTAGMPDGWAVSEHGKLLFSENGNRLFLGTAPKPYEVPDDSLPDDEKIKLDVWTWQDTRLQPQQLNELKDDKKDNYLAVVHLSDSRFVQLADKTVHSIRTSLKGDGQYALGQDRRKYEKFASWEWPAYQDVYVVDVNTGERELVFENKQHRASMSPAGKYVIWFDAGERGWYSYDVKSKAQKALTAKINVNFYDEDHDMPMLPSPYRVAGWTAGDAAVLIQDRYDFWQIDPTMARKPANLSKAFGRKNNIRFTYQKLDRDRLPVEEEMLLLGFDEDDKSYGVYRMPLEANDIPQKLVHTDHQYSDFVKAKDAESLLWRRQSFVEYADLWTGDMNMGNAQKLTDANPQQADYNWGTVDLMKWKEGKAKREALLVKPEDFDPNKKYPLLIYFYELSSQRKNSYYAPAPSRSTINWSMYASNGYLILVPDIRYKTGQPGRDALDAVDVAVDQLIESCDCVDEAHMALQGQSWGGYQIAYMVTQTDRYAAAMAGAPVSNMTSAYGGIRWGSGRSRMFQYERSQSRLGTTLWEDRDRYINNSPIFFAPNVNTPLLMMHNDNDGAVPWYQGIEFFVSLRRLEKPVWMLVYNGEQHNLTKWPNRVDLSIRMQQFFDHYLKGAPAPPWMTEGLPAVKKGEELGYE